MSVTLQAKGTNVEITMLPVTAGDATLINWSDGGTRHAVLIDAGLRENDAVSYLQSIGIFHLDLIILSHPDLDHLGGLPAIMKSRAMSVDRIWCFDLGFLQEFIRTGKIPPPKQATREVLYAYALRSTLDKFSDILRTANGKGVQILQVSEGYKLSLGGLLLEVLYPSQNFYDALHNPIALKRMLNRKIPDDWERDHEGGEMAKAQKLSLQQEDMRLTEIGNIPLEMPKEGVHLSDLSEEFEDEQPEISAEDEKLPWRMVGTLYNNLSIVVKVTALGGIKSPTILFPGDLSDWTTLVLRQWPNLKADILKVPHHGSKHISCDLETILEAMDYQFPLHLLFEKIYPFCGAISHNDWCRFYKLVRRGDPINVILNLVNPTHMLMFPHPQHHLPNMQLEKYHSKLVANRQNRDFQALSQKNNAPSPARISLGLEQHDVKEI